MRIVQLVSQSVLGGAETYGHALAGSLAERGHAVRLLSNRANGPLFERPRPDSLEVAELERSSRLDPAILRFLWSELREFRPDVLHSHNFGANTWARALGLLFPSLAVVCHVHSGRMVTSQPARRALLDRILFRRADLVIGLNQEMMAYLAGRLRVPSDRLLFLPNGIDMERFVPAPGARSPRAVVCVASLTEVKNHAMLLDAWSRVVSGRGPEARRIGEAELSGVESPELVLVGDGPLRPSLEARAAELGIAASVRFAGLRSDVLPFLRHASIFVLPSHREALPLALLEAMATGLVPVASAVGGIPEVVEHGRTGFLVPPGDVDALARELAARLDDPDGTRAIGTAARVAVESRYGLGAIVDRLVDAYEAALSRRRDGR